MKKLNFGCGKDIREGWDNVDIQKNPKIIKSFDFNKFPYPLKTNHYDYILVKQILSCLDKPEKVLFELGRICKPNAIIKISMPYYNNKGAFNSIKVVHYFSDMTFKVFVREPNMINKKNKFEIIKLELTPTMVGKFIFKGLREKLSLFFGGLISQIHVELRVVKN